VISLRPAPVHFGMTRELVIVGGNGERRLREAVCAELIDQARQGGYFHVVDSSTRGLRVTLRDRQIETDGFDLPLAIGEVGLWIDVHQAGDDKRSEVTLEITVFDATARILVAAHRVVAGSGAQSLSDVSAVDRAVRSATQKLLQQITPVEVTRKVELDLRDRAQLPILEVALDGNIARAREEMKSYLEQAPENATAIYNLAVLTEAMGQVESALSLYDKALQLSDNPLYEQTRTAAATAAELLPQ